MQPSPRRGQLSRPATDSWHMPRAPGQRSLVRYSAGGWRGTSQGRPGELGSKCVGQAGAQGRHYERDNCKMQNPEGCGWQASRLDSHPLPSQSWKGGSLQEDESDHGIHVHLPLHISGLGTPKYTPVSPVYLPQASRAGVSTPSCG